VRTSVEVKSLLRVKDKDTGLIGSVRTETVSPLIVVGSTCKVTRDLVEIDTLVTNVVVTN